MNLTLSTYHSNISKEYNIGSILRSFIMEKLNAVLSYIAGAMDGDGSFSIGKIKTKANPLYFPLMQLTNWRKSIIDVLVEEFGGTFVKMNPYKKKDGSDGHYIYRWRLRSLSNVKPVLERLIPFLRIKRKRAEFLLDFINNFEFIRGHSLKSSVLEAQEAAQIKMIQFNYWNSANNSLTSKIARKNTEDPVFWAYVAGMIDTDGSFSVKKQQRNKGTHVINPRYLPVISISSMDTRAINYIRQNCFFGNVYTPNNKDASSGFHFQFGIYSKKDCAEFIKRILPYLVGKKENAETLLDFCENSVNTKYCKGGISDEELCFREECYQKLISLNKYGVYKSSLIDLKLSAGNAGDDRAEAGVKAGHRERLSEKTS